MTDLEYPIEQLQKKTKKQLIETMLKMEENNTTLTKKLGKTIVENRVLRAEIEELNKKAIQTETICTTIRRPSGEIETVAVPNLLEQESET